MTNPTKTSTPPDNDIPEDMLAIRTLVRRFGFPPDNLDLFVMDMAVRAELVEEALSPDLSTAQAHRLASMGHLTRVAVAGNPAAPPDLLEALVAYTLIRFFPCGDVQLASAGKRMTTELQRALAGNPATPVPALHDLADSMPSRSVMRAVAANAGAPESFRVLTAMQA